MIDPKTSMEWLRFFFTPGRVLNPWHERFEESAGDQRLKFVWIATGVDFVIYASALSTQIFSNPLSTGFSLVIVLLRTVIGWWALTGLAHLKTTSGSFTASGIQARSLVWMAAATFAGFRHYELLVTRVINIRSGQSVVLEQLIRGSLSLVFLACVAAVVAAPREDARVLAKQTVS